MAKTDFAWGDRGTCRSYRPESGKPWPWDTDQLRGAKGHALMIEAEAIAKDICTACPVQRMCLEQGITLDYGDTDEVGIPEGIWGGMTPEERAETQGLEIRWVSGTRRYAPKKQYLGVTYRAKPGSVRSPYQAQLKHAGTNHYLGCYATPEEAGLAYNAKAVEIFGENAELNNIKVAA